MYPPPLPILQGINWLNGRQKWQKCFIVDALSVNYSRFFNLLLFCRKIKWRQCYSPSSLFWWIPILYCILYSSIRQFV